MKTKKGLNEFEVKWFTFLYKNPKFKKCLFFLCFILSSFFSTTGLSIVLSPGSLYFFDIFVCILGFLLSFRSLVSYLSVSFIKFDLPIYWLEKVGEFLKRNIEFKNILQPIFEESKIINSFKSLKKVYQDCDAYLSDKSSFKNISKGIIELIEKKEKLKNAILDFEKEYFSKK